MTEQNRIIELLEKIDKKLGFLIGGQVKEKSDSIKEQVAYLTSLTKDRNDISFMLGISSSYASKELSKLKAKEKKKVKK